MSFFGVDILTLKFVDSCIIIGALGLKYPTNIFVSFHKSLVVHYKCISTEV